MGKCTDECISFMESSPLDASSQATVNDLAYLGKEDMPKNDPYKDESQNVDTFPISDEEPEVTVEWGGNI